LILGDQDELISKVISVFSDILNLSFKCNIFCDFHVLCFQSVTVRFCLYVTEFPN